MLKVCRSQFFSRDIPALLRLGRVGLALSLLMMLGACQRFHPQTHDHVYVAARQVFLHDRVAAVSNRVAEVTNGEALEVIERGKRFVKVRTPKGEIGWLEDHAVIDDKLYGQFQDLAKQHGQDPVVATGQLRDDLYLHVLPGRESAHFLLIAGNAKVQLLERGTVEKTAGGPAPAKPKLTAPPAVAKPAIPDQKAALHAVPAPAGAPEIAPPPMEDWWLVRDGQGHTGWLLASRLDVDVPDEVGAYAEGQRMVAAYPIAKVLDAGAGKEHKGGEGKKLHGKGGNATSDASEESTLPENKEFTEYVTVLSPPKGGLPYDFDQVRVFTWSLNHHRYETAFRLRGIQGYLPVRMGTETVNGQPVPNFTFQIASGPNVSVDPQTGVTRPANPRTIAFRLEGNLVRRTGSDQGPISLAHEPVTAAAKAKAAAKKKKR